MVTLKYPIEIKLSLDLKIVISHHKKKMVAFIKVEVAGFSDFSFDRKLLNIIHKLRRM